MKDFIKWLGVNEKVAKVVVWIFIIMVFLIVTNTMLDSMGFPNYKITYDNLVKINTSQLVEDILTIVVSILSFYSVVLLVFRIKEAKPIFKYAVLFYIGNLIVNVSLGYVALQVYIFLYIVIFCYLYSNKNKKYILYSILAYIATILIQGIWYLSKAKFVDYSNLNTLTKSILSLDYFIIIGIIILVKEIYLKKRSEKEDERTTMGMHILDRRIQKRRTTSKKSSKKSSRQSKISK